MAKRKKSKPKPGSNLPANSEQKVRQIPRKKGTQTISASYQGPIPPSKEMENYGAIDPSFPGRILKMAELEQGHRHQMERQDLNLQAEFARKDFFEKRTGQIFAFVISLVVISSGTLLIINGHPVAGTVVSGTCLVGLVSAFIAGRAMDDKK